MKKILSFALVMCLLFAVGVMPASAKKELTSLYYDYCVSVLGDPECCAEIYIEDSFELDDVTYFKASGWVVPEDMETYQIIGEYCVHSTASYSPYELGVYVATNDEVYTLKTAFEEGIVKNVSCADRFRGVTAHYLGEKTEYAELTHTCMDAFARYKNFTPTENKSVACKVFGEADDAVVFRAYIATENMVVPCVCAQQRIGGYIFGSPYPYGPDDNPTGLYVLKDGEVYSALEAYEKGEISIKGLLSVVSAEEDPYNVEETVVEKLGFTKIEDNEPWGPYLYKEQYVHYENPSPYSADNPDYILIFAAQAPGLPIEPFDRIGDYAIESSAAYGEHHGYYIYVPATGALYDLRSAVEDAVDIKGIANAFLHMGKRAGIIGDTDKDRKITVKDATYIQKVLAEIAVPENYYHNVSELIRDFYRNDEVNIKDATAIQKAVAGLPYK